MGVYPPQHYSAKAGKYYTKKKGGGINLVDYYLNNGNSLKRRYDQKVGYNVSNSSSSLYGKTITGHAVYVSKIGNPTGNFLLRIYNQNNSSVLRSFSYDISTLGTSAEQVVASYDSITLTTGHRVSVEYNSGDSDNALLVHGMYVSDAIDGNTKSQLASSTDAWVNYSFSMSLALVE